jgi:hypothetical protein
MTSAQYKRGSAPEAAMGPSPGVWANCPVLDIMADPAIGMHIYEDWRKMSQVASLTNVTPAWGYYPYLEDGGTILITANTDLATVANRGIGHYVTITSDAGDNDQLGLQYFGGAGTGSPIAVMKAGGARMWFETAIRIDTITNGVANVFIGLSDETACANNMIADGGADISDIDVVGFAILHDDGDAFDAIYQTTGSAFVTAKDAAATIALSTWAKLGLESDGKNCIWYLNGSEVAKAALTATGFPDGEELLPLWTVKDDTTTAINMDIGWWRFAKLYE